MEKQKKSYTFSCRSFFTSTGNEFSVITVSLSSSSHLHRCRALFFLTSIMRASEEDLRASIGDFCCIQMRDNEEKRKGEEEIGKSRRGTAKREANHALCNYLFFSWYSHTLSETIVFFNIPPFSFLFDSFPIQVLIDL